MTSSSSSRPTLEACLQRVRRHYERTRAMFMNERPTPGDLTTPLLDAVNLFEALNIGYALIGGMAAMVYGRARVTEDIDFVADTDHEAVLARNPEVMRQHNFDPSCTWKLYHDSGVSVDIWKDEHAQGVISRSRDQILHARRVPVADPHDLIAMKLRANRIQDDYDISEILKAMAIDDARVRDMVDPERFEHYLAIKRRVGLA